MTEVTPTQPIETPAETTSTATTPTVQETSSTTSSGSEAPAEPGTGETLLTKTEEKPEQQTAPAEYADFKAPEGINLDKEAIAKYGPMFKELGLSQENAQKVVEAVARREADIVKAGKDAWHKMNNDWSDAAKAEFGSKFPEVRATIGRAIEGSGLSPEERAEFAQAMNLTAAGNNPAFIRMFYALAKQVTDGRPVAAGGPVDQVKPNGVRPASFAQAIYGGS